MKTISLTQGKMAQVDDEDYGWLSQWKWTWNGNGYARRSVKIGGKPCKVYMHRMVASIAFGLPDRPELWQVDHIDGDKDNNRRSNLRISNQSQNVANSVARFGTSKYKGVTWDRRRHKWIAQIMKDYKHVYIGRFEIEREAAVAYNTEALKLFEDFAKLNEVD